MLVTVTVNSKIMKSVSKLPAHQKLEQYWATIKCEAIYPDKHPAFLADRTNGRAIATLLCLSSVCRLWRYVLWLNGAS